MKLLLNFGKMLIPVRSDAQEMVSKTKNRDTVPIAIVPQISINVDLAF